MWNIYFYMTELNSTYITIYIISQFPHVCMYER